MKSLVGELATIADDVALGGIEFRAFRFTTKSGVGFSGL